MIFVYLPVYTYELETSARAFLAHHQPNSKPENYVLFCKSKKNRGSPLARVYPNDTLYVLAHGGDAGMLTLGDETFNDKNEMQDQLYTAPELAALMKDDKLDKAVKDIRLLACGSGLRRHAQTKTGHREVVQELIKMGKKTKKMHLYKPFAEALLIALRDKGYKKVQVTGYLGKVAINKGTGAARVTVKLRDEELSFPLEQCFVTYLAPDVFKTSSEVTEIIQDFYSRKVAPLSLQKKLKELEGERDFMNMKKLEQEKTIKKSEDGGLVVTTLKRRLQEKKDELKSKELAISNHLLYMKDFIEKDL